MYKLCVALFAVLAVAAAKPNLPYSYSYGTPYSAYSVAPVAAATYPGAAFPAAATYPGAAFPAAYSAYHAPAVAAPAVAPVATTYAAAPVAAAPVAAYAPAPFAGAYSAYPAYTGYSAPLAYSNQYPATSFIYKKKK